MTDPNDFSHVYARHDKLLAEANEKNKTALFQMLAGTTITRIHVSFDGEGDSGQINNITAYAGDTKIQMPSQELEVHCAHWGSHTLQTTVKPLDTAVEDLCYDFLSHEHDGWENNDGAFGEFEIDVATRSVKLEFNARFTDYSTHEHTF